MDEADRLTTGAADWLLPKGDGWGAALSTGRSEVVGEAAVGLG